MSDATRKRKARAPVDRPDIITFATHPSFLGLSISPAQETLLRGIYGLPLVTDEQRAIWALCTERPYIVGHQYPEASVLAGARSGKDSRIAAVVVLYEALFGGHAERAAKGETVMIPLIAQDARASGIAYGYIRSYLEQSPALASQLAGEPLTDRLTLTNGVVIACMPCTRTTARGFSIPVAVLDEVAFYRLEGAANSDAEIQASVRRGMIAFPGTSRLIKISTPYLAEGVMFEDHRRAFGKPDPDLLAWRAPSALMNPSIRTERLDQEQRLDPIRFRREYLSEFIDSLTVFLQRHLIDRAVVTGRKVLEPRAGVSYVVAVDGNLGGGDAFTLSVGHAEGRGAALRVVQDYLEGRTTRTDATVDLEAIVAAYAAVTKRYGQTRVYGDRLTTAKHGGWIVEAFARHGVRYLVDHVVGPDGKPKHLTASDAYLAAEPLFVEGRIDLLDSEVQTREFAQLERRALPGGDAKVTHPKGDRFHDDHANAASLMAAIASWRAKRKVFEGLEYDPVTRSATSQPTRPRQEPAPVPEGHKVCEACKQPRPHAAFERLNDKPCWTERDLASRCRDCANEEAA